MKNAKCHCHRPFIFMLHLGFISVKYEQLDHTSLKKKYKYFFLFLSYTVDVHLVGRNVFGRARYALLIYKFLKHLCYFETTFSVFKNNSLSIV